MSPSVWLCMLALAFGVFGQDTDDDDGLIRSYMLSVGIMTGSFPRILCRDTTRTSCSSSTCSIFTLQF